MMKLPLRFALIGLTFLAAAVPSGRAIPEAEATAGRLALRNLADSVVSVKLTVTLKASINGRDLPPRESNVDVNATVITAEGLTVTSLAAVDPKMAYEALRLQMAQNGLPTDLVGAETKAVRIRLADGTEVPAEQVGKDPARDLVYFAPVRTPASKGRTYTYVDLRQAAESVVVMGDCLHLMRLGDTMQRIAVVRPGSIIAVTERPRRVFLTSTDLYSEGVGCPVFDAEGRVLGICLRFIEKDIPHNPVVVPAAEVAEQGGNF